MIRNVDLLEARLPVSVLVDDNTGFEAGVAVGGGSVPDVHAHARLLAIGRSGEVGVVGARAVLGVQDDIVGTTATSTVVVDLEVTSNLVEAEGVEQVVVGVRGVEQLGDGSVYVRRWRGGRGGVRENVVVAAATARPVVVEVGSATGRVGLGDGVVATSHGVGGRASTVPAELRCGGVPGVAESRPATFARVVDSPGAVYLLVKLESHPKIAELTKPGMKHQQTSRLPRGLPPWCWHRRKSKASCSRYQSQHGK